MKVDSTDATNFSVKSPNTPQVQKTVEKPKHQEHGSTVEHAQTIMNKPVSQISDFERGELTISEKSIIEAIEKANKAVLGRNTTCKFSIHEATKKISIKIVDSDTNEVIREIPPEKVLDMVAKLEDKSGIFVDKKG